MKLDQILELGKLGFTKNEIMGIMNAQSMTGLNQITSPHGTEQDATNTALLTAINTLTATLQAGNLSASGKSVNSPRTSENVAKDLMNLMN